MANEEFNTEMTIDQAVTRVNDAFQQPAVQPSPTPTPVPTQKATQFIVWCPVDQDGAHFKYALIDIASVADFEEDLKTYAQELQFPDTTPIFCMYIKTREEHTPQEVHDYIDQFSETRSLKLGRVDVMTV